MKNSCFIVNASPFLRKHLESDFVVLLIHGHCLLRLEWVIVHIRLVRPFHPQQVGRIFGLREWTVDAQFSAVLVFATTLRLIVDVHFRRFNGQMLHFPDDIIFSTDRFRLSFQ